MEYKYQLYISHEELFLEYTRVSYTLSVHHWILRLTTESSLLMSLT